jgi:DNA-directed RNA polymerase subunit RPC12/RpoP
MLATRLKAHYDYACMACGSRLLIGAKPDSHYAEAAHIKPLGTPHNGPDKAGNLLVLCPNHHLQFDKGVLSLRMRRTGAHFLSRVPGDPIEGRQVPVKAPHVLDDDCVRWHTEFFARVGK